MECGAGGGAQPIRLRRPRSGRNADAAGGRERVASIGPQREP